MGSDLRMGLDPRDCRCDAAMILGDEVRPDNVNWKLKDRDKTCAWLDFVDGQFDPCDNSAANVANVKAIHNVRVELEAVLAPRKMSTEVESTNAYQNTTLADKISVKTADSRVCAAETSAPSSDRTITVNVPTKGTKVVTIENKTIEVRGD
jgi:hypothetical protein